MKIRLALAQIDTQLGNLKSNLDKHLSYISESRTNSADLIIFPELSLTGYFLQDLVQHSVTKPEATDPIFGPLLTASKDIDIVVGFVDEDARTSRRIAAAYLSQGEVQHIHHKVYLPTYGIFDDLRHFKAGNKIRAFNTRFGRIGMLICEDFWHASPPYILYADGADIQLYISASPSRGLTNKDVFESGYWVTQVSSAYASLFSSFIINTNRVGFEDGINFWGGATAHDPDGNLIAAGPTHEETLSYADLDLAQIRRTRTRLPMVGDERLDLTLRELQRIIEEQG